MASKANTIDTTRLFILVLLTLPLKIASTNIDCNGKSFRCMNSTHFMICVDLGGGVSSTVDNLVIACPLTTICQSTNRFECEFPATETTTDFTTFGTTVITTNQWVNVDNSTTAPMTHLEEYTDVKNFTTLFPSKATANLEVTTEAYVSGATSYINHTEIIGDINNGRVTSDLFVTAKTVSTAPLTDPHNNADMTTAASLLETTSPNVASDMFPIQTINNTYNGSSSAQFPIKATSDLEVTTEAYVSGATSHKEIIGDMNNKRVTPDVFTTIEAVTSVPLTDASHSNSDMTTAASPLETTSPNLTSYMSSIQTASNTNNGSTSTAQSYPDLSTVALALETTSTVTTSGMKNAEVTRDMQIGTSRVQMDVTIVPFASEITTLALTSDTLNNVKRNNNSDVQSVGEVSMSTKSLLIETTPDPRSDTHVPENIINITDKQNNDEVSTEHIKIGSTSPDVTTYFLPQDNNETTVPFDSTTEYVTEQFTASDVKTVTVTSSSQNTTVAVAPTEAMTETIVNTTDGTNGPTVAIIEISYGNSTENIIDMNPTEAHNTKMTTKSNLGTATESSYITGKEELINVTMDNASDSVFYSTVENTYPNVTGTTVTQSYFDGITVSIFTETTLSASLVTENTTENTFDSSNILEKTANVGLENTTMVMKPVLEVTKNYVVTETTPPVFDSFITVVLDKTPNLDLGTTKITTDSVLDIPTTEIRTIRIVTDIPISTGLESTTTTSDSVYEITTNSNTLVLEATSSNTVTESTTELALDSSIISETASGIEIETTTNQTLNYSTILEKTTNVGLENTTLVTKPALELTTNYVVTEKTTKNPPELVIDSSITIVLDKTPNIDLGTTKITTDSVLDISTTEIPIDMRPVTEIPISTGLESTTTTSDSVFEITTNSNTIVLEVTSSNTVTESITEPAMGLPIISEKASGIEIETSKTTTEPTFKMAIPTTLQTVATSILVTAPISETVVDDVHWPAVQPNTFPVYYTQINENVTPVYNKETYEDISMVPNSISSNSYDVIATTNVLEDSTMRTTASMNSIVILTTVDGLSVAHKNTFEDSITSSTSSPGMEITDLTTKYLRLGTTEIATKSTMTTNIGNSATNVYISTAEEEIFNTTTIPGYMVRPSGFPLVTENFSTTNTSLRNTTTVNLLEGYSSTNKQQPTTEPIANTNTITFTDNTDFTKTTERSSTLSLVPHKVLNTGNTITSSTEHIKTTSSVTTQNHSNVMDDALAKPIFDGDLAKTKTTIVLENATPIILNINSDKQDTTTSASSISLKEDTYVHENNKLLLNDSMKPGIPTTIPSSPSLAALVKYTEPMTQKESLTTGISTTPAFPEKTTKNNSKADGNKARKFDCTNRKIGIYPDNDDCKIFHECNGIDIDSVDTDRCPENTVFSSFKKKCTKDLSHCVRNKEFKCVSEGRFYDYLEPNVYYICVKNTYTNVYVRFKFQCQNGYHFNKKSVRCELNQSTTTVKASIENISAKVTKTIVENSTKSVEDSYECEDEEGFSCKNLGSGKYVDNNDCGKFYACYGPHLAIGKCPPGAVFSDIKKQCTTDLSHCVRNKQFICVSEGRFHDYYEPNVYYVCVKNTRTHVFVRFKFQCQKGYYLDKKTVKCEKEESNVTKQNVDLISVKKEIRKSNKKPKTRKTELRNDFECEKSGRYRDPHDCRIYYVCSETSSNELKRIKKKCDSDEVFNEDEKECVDAESYSCS